MPYNFYIDNKKEDNTIKPYSKSQDDSELHTNDPTSSKSDNSEEIKADSENETKSKEKFLDTKEKTVNYNINPQSQNQKNMNETNGTQGGEFFGNQIPQSQQQNSQMNNSNINSTQNQSQRDPKPQTIENGENYSQATKREPQMADGYKPEYLNQNQQSEQEGIEKETSAATLTEAEDLPPFKSEVWDMFKLQLKDKDSFFKQKDYPRKPLMIDADLYSTLREIDIENIAPTNLLNAILRTFIESFKEELRQYRKLQAPSVF